MRYEDLPCQHGGKIGTCQHCSVLRAELAKAFKAGSDKIAVATAQWLAEIVQKDGPQAALEQVVQRVAALRSIVARVAYGYIECLTMIAKADDLETAKACVAIMSVAGSVMSGSVVESEIVDRLEAECRSQGLYEKLAQVSSTQGARGAAILRGIE